MFIETHLDTINDEQVALAFIKSSNVQAFPCGRRRSTLIGNDLNNDGFVSEAEGFRIPFDPEARLNTEANNRKHSSLNGYTQTYLKSWNNNMDGKLVLSIAGYLFGISLATDYISEYGFCNHVFDTIINKIKKLDKDFDEESFTANHSRIYANIVIEDVQLFAGFQNYYTGVLQSQSTENTSQVLDLLCTDKNPEDINSYYFSGLSFSVAPLTGINETRSELKLNSRQTIISLCVLQKDAGVWCIHEAARLPEITHGDTENSVVLGDLTASSVTTPKATIADEFNVTAHGDIELTANAAAGSTGSISAESIKAKKLMQGNKPVPVIELAKSTDNYNNACWQLKITLDPKA